MINGLFIQKEQEVEENLNSVALVCKTGNDGQIRKFLIQSFLPIDIFGDLS